MSSYCALQACWGHRGARMLRDHLLHARTAGHGSGGTGTKMLAVALLHTHTAHRGSHLGCASQLPLEWLFLWTKIPRPPSHTASEWTSLVGEGEHWGLGKHVFKAHLVIVIHTSASELSAYTTVWCVTSYENKKKQLLNPSVTVPPFRIWVK